MDNLNEQWVSIHQRTPTKPGWYKVKFGDLEKDRFFDCSDIHEKIWKEANVMWRDKK